LQLFPKPELAFYLTASTEERIKRNEKRDKPMAYMEKLLMSNPKEFEVDVVCDKNDILIPGIMEHIERSGIHSGDSFCVYPPQTLSETVIKKALDFSKKIARALQVIGLMNIQFIAKDDDVYVIEVNPRASRTVPMMSKITKVPMVKLAINIMFAKSLKSQGYGSGLLPQSNLVAVKAPVFSFQKLTDVDIALNAEMKSTGEVLGIDNCYEKALIKAFMAAGIPFVEKGKVLVSIRKKDLEENIPVVKKLQTLGFTIISGECNKNFFDKENINVELIDKTNISEIEKQIKSGEIKMVFNLPEKDGNTNAPDFKLRKLSVIYKIPCFTCSDTIREYLKAWEYRISNPKLDYKTIEEYMK